MSYSQIYFPFTSQKNKKFFFKAHSWDKVYLVFWALLDKKKNMCTLIVHYDTCDLSGPLLHGMKLAPERSEGDNSCRAMSHWNDKYRILFYSTFT